MSINSFWRGTWQRRLDFKPQSFTHLTRNRSESNKKETSTHSFFFFLSFIHTTNSNIYFVTEGQLSIQVTSYLSLQLNYCTHIWFRLALIPFFFFIEKTSNISARTRTFLLLFFFFFQFWWVLDYLLLMQDFRDSVDQSPSEAACCCRLCEGIGVFLRQLDSRISSCTA